MTIMITEKEKQFQIADYKNLAEKLVKRGSLFALFKLQTEMIRVLTADDEPDVTQKRITEFLGILKEVTDDCLTCPKCQQSYIFRICTGLSYEKDNAIELTCNGCGDCFSHSEKKSHAIYFNFEAWREVDNLRKISRGFAISYRLIDSPKKAFLYIYDKKDTRPELWINGYRVFNSEEVKSYWEYSKGLIKRWKKDEKIQLSFIQIENAKIYTLDKPKSD
ncbi:hypothetical protein V3851_25290 [Paenibacillus sp. M1]|uniref:Uncharacterized protein n=1 Tax=Paenibacillus haidiansis TaxID=1574488 RepID=A0ABU7VZI1_9BACL